MTLTVIPSKLNLLKQARPLRAILDNRNITTLVVDRSIDDLFAAALRGNSRLAFYRLEQTDSANLVVIGLDAAGQFVGSYRGEDWPHVHPCPECGTHIRCECIAGELDFDDCLSLCANCKTA
jgi:hypothetical protein